MGEKTKKKLLISFSGGETSAFMTQWLWNHMQDEYDMVVVFANTGQENEETLLFVEHFSSHYKIPIVWVEAVVRVSLWGKIVEMCGNVFMTYKWKGGRLGTRHRVVNFNTADRDGKVFESVIQKYGIPNQAMPQCTRELKQRPISSYGKEYFKGKNYYTAIGIRSDEIDRQNAKATKRRIIYPLITLLPTKKPVINLFWSGQPFRLNLKGYEGNCMACWKKGLHKLYRIAKDTPYKFNWPAEMEFKYSHYTPKERELLMEARNEKPKYPIVFFRGNRSALDILKEAKEWDGEILDDSEVYDLHNESCEVFSECGDT